MYRFIFADYHGRAVTGEYMPAECEAILIDTDREESLERSQKAKRSGKRASSMFRLFSPMTP